MEDLRSRLGPDSRPETPTKKQNDSVISHRSSTSPLKRKNESFQIRDNVHSNQKGQHHEKMKQIILTGEEIELLREFMQPLSQNGGNGQVKNIDMLS
jgi:hypothetical protein